MANTALVLGPEGVLASYMVALPALDLSAANNLQLCHERPVRPPKVKEPLIQAIAQRAQKLK
jgi:hypothetical protein